MAIESTGSQAIVNADGTTNRIWQSSYTEGVPGDIDLNTYDSLNHYFDIWVDKYRERPGFVSIGTEMSYDRLDKLVRRTAGWMRQQGIKKGDRVAIMLPNSLQYPICLFATLRVGAIVVNVNPLYTAHELHHQLVDSGAETLFVMENFGSTAEQALPGTAVKRVVLTQIGDLLSDGWINAKGRALNFVMRNVQKMVPKYKLPDAVWMRDVIIAGATNPVDEAVCVDRNDTAFLQYTGGTTGVAKGAVLSHGNILANCQQCMAFIEPQMSDEIETIVTPLPLYHIYSLTVNCLIFMAIGGRNILIANPRDTKRVSMILKNEKFTAISSVNTLFASLLEDPDFVKRDFSKLKISLAGGMALQRNVAETWKEVTGDSIAEGYGLTECSPVVCVQPIDISQPRSAFTGTIGVPVPSTDVGIRREDGSWGCVGERGELCVRGPQVMQGYWMRPEETALVLDSDGWLSTGDVAVMDELGFLKIVDRIKDLIIVSGFNVYPNEIEDAVAMHPDVLEVCAIGVPDNTTGEAVKIVVVPRSSQLTKEELKTHCRQYLTGYKMPKLIEFRDEELPKTPVGKILRREVRECC